MKPTYQSLDETLRTLAAFGPDLRNGNTNHAPMAVEALCALGREDAVQPWLARYRAELLPMPARCERVTAQNWRAALARTERAADWSAFFAEELLGAPWREVLDRWVGRLAPALCASATHGVIRVGHAVRALALGESPARLRELADALASWAYAYQELPTAAGSSARGFPADEAIRRVPVVPRERRRFAGTIVSSLEALGEFQEFAPAIDTLEIRSDPAAQLGELTRVFARVFVANAHDTLTAIVFIHGVTSATALGHLLPHLSPANQRAGMRFAWQAGCALYSAFGARPEPAGIEPPRDSPETLADRAVVHGDEHAIKLAEACLARNAIQPDPAYLAAIASALRLLPAAAH
ncbi:MAG: questin oxidase family protein [Myxococcota bacterium]